MNNIFKRFLPNGVDHHIFNAAAPLQNPNYGKSDDAHIVTYYRPSDYTFEIISEEKLTFRIERLIYEKVTDCILDDLNKMEREKGTQSAKKFMQGYLGYKIEDDLNINGEQIREKIRKKAAEKIKNGTSQYSIDKVRQAVKFDHSKHIYLVKSDKDKKISRCLIFPDKHGTDWKHYETINIQKRDFSDEMQEAILRIPKRTLKKDPVLLNGSRSADFKKHAVLKMVEAQENDNKRIKRHYKEKNTGHGLYSWKSRYINHAFNVAIGQNLRFANKYNLSIKNVTTTGIDGNSDKKITSNIMHIKNNNDGHNGKVMVIFVGNQQYPEDGLSLIRSYFLPYKGDFIIADYSQFLLMKNEKYGDANINDLVNYGKTVLRYPADTLDEYDEKNIETYGYSLGSYVAALSHNAAFTDSKEGENAIFLANALAHPAKFLDSFMFSWAAKLMRWILLSRDFRRADAGVAWKGIRSIKVAFNTADDNVVNTGCSLYSSQETWWDYVKFWGRREDTSVHLLRHQLRSDMSLLKHRFNHAHVANFKNLRQRVDYDYQDQPVEGSAKDLIDNFITKKGEERKTKIPKKFYRRRWNKLSTFFWLPVKVVGTIFFLGVCTSIALVLKYWKIATLFLVAMAAMSVASIFFSPLPLVLIAGLIGAKIFSLSAVGMTLIANIRNIPGWLSKHPLRCTAVVGAALIMTALCFASVFFPVLPVIFAVSALAAKITTITTFVVGVVGFIGSILAGIVRRCTLPKSGEVFHDEEQAIKSGNSVDINASNSPQMRFSKGNDNDRMNDETSEDSDEIEYETDKKKNEAKDSTITKKIMNNNQMYQQKNQDNNTQDDEINSYEEDSKTYSSSNS